MKLAENLHDSYPAVADSVPRVREAVAAIAAAAGASQVKVDAVRLAVSEAITNAVLHAYKNGSGSIDVSTAVGPEELEVLVGDDGGGLCAERDRPGLGMGIALMALISDAFSLSERSSGGIEVRLEFSLAGPA